ncbi:zinc finger protein [Macleaya cordata]|uniref:RING-type E3 ubiquitin transferase n=1 Tax=Macleaya cordata TaxID=56857 RepID=A0A200PZS4_MACCD|nr:zinc finger protein [Macleaya cordata]
MTWIESEIQKKDHLLTHRLLLSPLLSPPPLPSSPSFSSPYSTNYQKESTPPSSSGSRISPAVLFIIVILAVIFFISGLLHLLVRFLIKQPSSSSNSQSGRYPEMSGSDALQRQLQQLFHLHDSGLDQAFIDALPVFLYKEIMGLKEPFDCPVCLCEFSEEDKLRLLPMCSHAFHINCIDTWLLSNSTCPLCRGTLFTSGFSMENPVFDFDEPREEDGLQGDCEAGFSSGRKPVELEEIVGEKRVYPVRLGKFRNVNNGGAGVVAGVEREAETSSSNLDARRCFSMGSFQYVVGESNLQVALSQDKDESGPLKLLKGRVGQNGNSSLDVDLEGKKLSSASKGESFSVSKIWLWSKKGKYPSSSLNLGLPWTERTQGLRTQGLRTQDIRTQGS